MKKVCEMIIKVTLFFLLWLVGASIIPAPEFENPAIWRLFAELIPLLVICFDTFLFWSVEKRQINLCLNGQVKKGILTGSVVGMAWLAIPSVMMYLLKVICFEGTNSISYLGIWFVSAFLNVMMQELLIRGYLYQMLKQKGNVIVATIVTTAIFTLLHGGAFETGVIPVLNVLTMSLFMTVLLEYTKSLWTPIMAHFIWNAVGALILNEGSLADDYPHVLCTVFVGNDILSGGACKIEGSIVVLIVNVVFIALFMVLIKHRANESEELLGR